MFIILLLLLIPEDIEKIAIPRASGTENNQIVREYIKNELTKAGLQVREQRFEGGTNIIAGKGKIVIGCHYDSIGPGADDNASGVAVALDVAKKVKGVTFVFFDAEERGLLGSKYYVKNLKVLPDSMINLDMVGHLRKESRGSLKKYDWAKAVTIKGDHANSDNSPFIRSGVDTIWIFTGMHNRVHSKRDTKGTLDYKGLDDISEYIVFLTKPNEHKINYILRNK